MPLPDADVFTVMRTVSSTNASDERNDPGMRKHSEDEKVFLEFLSDNVYGNKARGYVAA